MKFYAVKVGRNPGIYTVWSECEQQVKGHSGAIFKSFKTIIEAKAFMGELDIFIKGVTSSSEATEPEEKASSSQNARATVFYTDGTYDAPNNGGAAVDVTQQKVYYASMDGKRYFDSNRGELLGIYLALKCSNGDVIIHSDSATSINILSHGYTAKKNLDLIEPIRALMSGRSVSFMYVKAYSGIVYNELADKYAAQAAQCEPSTLEKLLIYEEKL